MIAEHVKARGHQVITPTVRMVRYWWARLNAEVFGGELLPPVLSVYHQFDDAYGSCTDIATQRVHINIEPDHKWTRALLIETVVHEMVHQKQHHDGGTMHHGETFDRWREPVLIATGITKF
jgi:hypothetical protein